MNKTEVMNKVSSTLFDLMDDLEGEFDEVKFPRKKTLPFLMWRNGKESPYWLHVDWYDSFSGVLRAHICRLYEDNKTLLKWRDESEGEKGRFSCEVSFHISEIEPVLFYWVNDICGKNGMCDPPEEISRVENDIWEDNYVWTEKALSLYNEKRSV